jgi:MoaA/NifB/PqqE/SkfB family radical SAM enzyme
MIKAREDVTSLTIYTGSNGQKGCTCRCIGCSQEKYGLAHPFYQGTIEQIYEVLDIFPNLKRTIILGNPDPTVDTNFCNRVAKILIEKNIRVRFSTSGFRASQLIPVLCDRLDPEMVDYVSFSIDSIDEIELEKMKGRKICFKELEKAIQWCIKHNYRLKVQPTFWTTNIDEYKMIVDFFHIMGINWFSFHAGSCEAFVSDEVVRKHVDPWEWRKLVKSLGEYCSQKGISLHLPYLFVNEEEYKKFIKKKGEKCNINELKNTQVWLENNYIRTTHCPLLNEVMPFHYNLMENEKISFEIKHNRPGYCPITKECLGTNLAKESVDGYGFEFIKDGKEKLFSICRFYNFEVNYPDIIR